MLTKGSTLLTNPMCLFFWNLIAALFARIFSSCATAQEEKITPPLAENKRAHGVNYRN
jgi:hypothetical protein